jgi:hypothetical protein
MFLPAKVKTPKALHVPADLAVATASTDAKSSTGDAPAVDTPLTSMQLKTVQHLISEGYNKNIAKSIVVFNAKQAACAAADEPAVDIIPTAPLATLLKQSAQSPPRSLILPENYTAVIPGSSGPIITEPNLDCFYLFVFVIYLNKQTFDLI